jgi:repressor LexA
MSSKELTPRQLAFLRVLIDFQRTHGVPPTIRQLQKLCGFASPRSVVQYLDALVAAGYIERQRGARNIKVLRAGAVEDRTDTVSVPLVGHVAAGLPILAEQNIDEYFSVSTTLARPPHSYFILRVSGTSMDRAGLNDGDLVLVRQQVTAQPGDRVVALIDDSATVKVFRPGVGVIVLEPRSSDPSHKPIVVDDEFRIQGVVVATIPNVPGDS